MRPAIEKLSAGRQVPVPKVSGYIVRKVRRELKRRMATRGGVIRAERPSATVLYIARELRLDRVEAFEWMWNEILKLNNDMAARP